MNDHETLMHQSVLMFALEACQKLLVDADCRPYKRNVQDIVNEIDKLQSRVTRDWHIALKELEGNSE